MSEVWKDVIDYEGLYQVSDLGRVKSLERIDKNNHPVRERILIASDRGNGYPVVSLCFSGKVKSHSVHRVVMESFKGKSCKQINHKNKNKTDNILTNLEYLNSRENNTHGKLGVGSSPYIGVSWVKKYKTWSATIEINKRNKHLGYFKEERQAAIAYIRALVKYNIKNKYAFIIYDNDGEINVAH